MVLLIGLVGAFGGKALAANPAVASGSAGTNPNFSAPAIGGVYGMVTWLTYRGKLDSGVASNPNVSGLLFVFPWSNIETADGVYNWTSIDGDIASAHAAGKKVVIALQAGVASPSWLYNERAQSLNYTWDQSWGNFTPCSKVRMPLPWDATFLAKWKAMVAALGARYDTNQTVAAVKLEGFNGSSAELTLPLSVNEQINVNGYQCTGPNYIALWQAAGYTRTLAESAWNQIAADFAQAFPNTPFEAMMSPSSFPPIDQDGNLLVPPGSGDTQANTDVVNGAIITYGQQFVLANDGLTAKWVWPFEKSESSVINTGYQMVTSPMGPDLPAAVTLALSAKPAFIEIGQQDIDDPALAATIASAAAALP